MRTAMMGNDDQEFDECKSCSLSHSSASFEDESTNDDLETLRKMIVAPKGSVFISGKACLERKRGELKQAIRGWSMEPDAVQREKKPLECRLILRRCSYLPVN